MKPLAPASRRFLERANEADLPSVDAQERLWRSLEARLELPLPASAKAASEALGSSVAPVVGASSSATALFGIATAAAVSVAGLVWYATPPTAAPTQAPRSATLQTAPSVAAPPPDEPADVAPAPARATAPPANSVSSTLDEESRLLAAAQRFLQAGVPVQAWTRLEQHRRRFPAGQLAQERDAARVTALCALGRISEADRAARRYRRSWPDSALEPRCSEEGSR
jgi:hypothetical protein